MMRTCFVWGFILMFSLCVCGGPDALATEDTYLPAESVQEVVQEQSLGFFSCVQYVARIITAPFMIMVLYPNDEEPDLYQVYLKYVNNHSGRQWKKEPARKKIKKQIPSGD